MITRLAFVALALLIAIPASAQFVTDLAAIPVAARGPGLQGTQWVTDLTIHNPMDHPMNIFLAFLPADQDNDGDENLKPLHLEPHETMILEDVISSLFDLDEDIKGIVTINCGAGILNNPEGTVFQAVARIYNTGGGDGTYGQTVPALFAVLNVGWSPSVITGARNDEDYRSNLGICGMSFTEQVEVHYRVTAADGSVVIEDSKVLHTSSLSQWSFEQLGVGVADGPLTVELWIDPDQVSDDPCADPTANSFFAYVSKVDNSTGDAEFIYASPMEPFICPAEE
jgi:hypothetical protein